MIISRKFDRKLQDNKLFLCSAERVLAYGALETAALVPQTLITFIADGMSKDRTKVCSLMSFLFL